jgi:Na+-driven multidrug efflux pump
MTCNLVGAVINTVLDALFVFVLQWGMSGAAIATVIGQVVSGAMAVYMLLHAKSITLAKAHFIPRRKYVGRILSLGAAPCSNQLAMMVVQIVMNKSLKHYGSLSVYGEAIPIACAGIITKVNQVFLAFIIGISQGLQPIVSFNYGAKKYARVKKAYLRAAACGFVLAVFAFSLFQLIPRQIISLFGDGSDAYYSFAESYFRIFLFFTFLNFLQPITSNFFTAIGKPKGGIFLSLTRQIIFLLPLILILPLFMGIDGIMYAGPVADLMAGITAIVMVTHELRKPMY